MTSEIIKRWNQIAREHKVYTGSGVVKVSTNELCEFFIGEMSEGNPMIGININKIKIKNRI